MARRGSTRRRGLATAFGFRATIWVAVAVFVIAAAIVLFSPLRTARHEDVAPPE